MLDSLPAEILLQICKYVRNWNGSSHPAQTPYSPGTQLDSNTLTKVNKLSRRLHAIIEIHLHEIYRKRTIALNTDWDADPVLPDKHNLRFAKELVFAADPGDCYVKNCFYDSKRPAASLRNPEDGLSWAVIPLYRGLVRDGVVSFRWELGSCVPHHLLGPGGYMCENQRNIECLALDTSKCANNHGDGLSIWMFHRVRSFSWKGVCKIKDCVSLMDFFSCNAHQLEKLELGVHHSLSTNLRGWEDPQGNQNAFAVKILQLQKGHAQTSLSRLRELSLCGVDFKYAVPEMAYAFQLHQLRHLTLRQCATISELLGTIADITTTVQLNSLDMEIDAANNEDTDAFERFFHLSLPNLEDVYIHVDALDELSLSHRIHWRSVFSLRTRLRRFVYHRRLAAHWPEVDTSTPPDTAVKLDEEMLALLSGANLQCLAISEDPSTLMAKLSQDDNDIPPFEWEILHIRTAPTHLTHYLHNLQNNIPTRSLDFESLNNLLSIFSYRFPGLSFNFSAHTKNFAPVQLLEFFTFAAWAFGAKGLPKLELLVYGEVESVHKAGKYITLCRNQTTSPLCLPFRPLDAVGYPNIRASRDDVAMRRKFQSHAAFFETMPSSQWEFTSLGQ
ncbi:uncharacterized protein BDV17DRAFT_291177 [Aspergillus undulatus]|uniref:uncharacterized protein n=1 Tax=Aspergillus undulatus TaxID=1810928 RepID=UPI003CCD9F29